MKKNLLAIFLTIFISILSINCKTFGQIVLSENFSGFTGGSHAAPSGTDVSATLDSKTSITGWTGAKIYEAGGEIKLGTSSVVGNLTTPAIDLSNNSGNFVVQFDIARWTGDAATVQVYLDGTAIGPVITPSDNFQTVQILGTGGTSSSKIKIAGLTKRFYLDNISVYYDKTAPIVTFDPTTSSSNVPINILPTITFDEPVLKTDGTELVNDDLSSLITFKKGSETGDAVTFSAIIDASKKVITVTPSGDLLNSQAYYLAVGPVEDAGGNETTASSSTFTTIASTSPSVAITSQISSEVYHAGDAINITWTSANVTNVQIDIYNPKTSVYDPVIASTPATAGTYSFTIPALYGYSAGYKIKISDVDNPTTCFSESSAFTVIGVATSISDLRTRFGENDIVRLSSEATVTFIRTANRNQKYIQDSQAGLLVDDPTPVLTTTVAVGDNIKDLEGSLSLYGGVLELTPKVATVTVASSGNTVTIPEMTIPDYTANYLKYESMLIKIKNVRFTAGDGTATFAANTNYDLSDGTNTITYRSFKAGESDLIGSIIPKNNFNGTFIAGFYNTTIQVYGRNASDFVSTAKSITSFIFKGLNPEVTATIDESAKTITAAVPAGTNLTTLVPTIVVSDKATVNPASGATVNFTSPVTFTVTAEDGTTQAYTATVSVKTGINDNPESNITVYPVPATTTLYITNAETVKLIEIFNVAGIKVETIKDNSMLPLSLEGYKPGIYFVRLTTAQGTFMKRFIKQ